MAVSDNTRSQEQKKMEESIKTMVKGLLHENNKAQDEKFYGMFNELKTLISGLISPLPSSSSSPENTQNPSVPTSNNPSKTPPPPTHPTALPPLNPPVSAFIDLSVPSHRITQPPTPNSNTYQMATRFTKIEFPRFDGSDLESWLFKAERFFQVDYTPPNTKIKLAANIAENTKEEPIVLLCLQGVCENASLKCYIITNPKGLSDIDGDNSDLLLENYSCSDLPLGNCSWMFLKEDELEKWRKLRYKHVNANRFQYSHINSELLLGNTWLLFKEQGFEMWRRSKYRSIQGTIHWFSKHIVVFYVEFFCLGTTCCTMDISFSWEGELSTAASVSAGCLLEHHFVAILLAMNFRMHLLNLTKVVAPLQVSLDAQKDSLSNHLTRISVSYFHAP